MFEKIVKMYKRELITLQEMIFKFLSLPEIDCKLLDIEGNNIYIKLSINKEIEEIMEKHRNN
jgi:hypothetical protein